MSEKYKLDLQMFTGEADRVSIDLTQLSGYAALADGQYTLTVKAKATGYEDSAVSAGVSWTKTTPLPQLSAPEILSVTQDLVMTYTEVPNAEYYDIYVDGVLEDSIDVRPVTTFSNIHIKATSDVSGEYGGDIGYSTDGGTTWVLLTTNNEVVLNDITSLKIKIVDQAGPSAVAVDTSSYYGGYDDITGVDIYYSRINTTDSTDNVRDITQYLQNGCYVSLIATD